MHINLSDIQKRLLTGVVLFLATSTNYIFISGGFIASCFCITIGLALGIYYNFEKKIIYYIFSSIFLSHIVFRYLFLDEQLYKILYVSLGLSLVSVLVLYIMRRIAFAFNIIDSISLRNSFIYIASTLTVSILAGILITNLMIISNSSLDIIQLFLKWSTGMFFGITIFGTAMLFSFYYKEGLRSTLIRNLFGIIYLIVFIVVTSLLFSNTVGWLTFEKHSYIFIIFYGVLAFMFSYRLLLITDVLFVLLYQFFYMNMSGNIGHSYEVLNIGLYLLVLSTFASSVKVAIYELDLKNQALVKSSLKLENLVYSTDSLLKLSDDILDSDIKFQENYLSRIFEIACKIFDNYDFAACYIRKDNKVYFIETIGYDVAVLNSFNFTKDNIDYIDTANPIHINDEDKSLRTTLKDKYNEFTEIYPKMSEAIRFGIYIDKDTLGSISFDIARNSGKKFLRDDFESMKSFQKLMNSFLSINNLNFKNISLKNDIVLSLIRTLELYDHYTGGHSEEVAYLSKEISMRLGLNEHQMYDIYWAGVVHDIGKVGIPSNIINKASKLSLEEYELIKEHTIFGYDILRKAEDLKDIAILVKHHHEWWNGSGYPSELKGNSIPLGSQIIAICDAVSTMAKKRPYTTVKTSSDIVDELTLYSGVQFSPEPTKHMINFINEGLLDKYYQNR